MSPRAAPRVTIRPAGPRDVEPILAVEQAAFAHPDDQFTRRQIRYLICRARGAVLVAVVKGQVRGWAAGLLRTAPNSTSGRVYSLAVDPQAQGLGIGRQLLDRLLHDLRQRGANRLSLEVAADNAGAIHLYRRAGFIHSRHLPHYYGRGRHGLRLVRHRSR